jgi:RNA-directed DNA polymerase
MCLLLILLAAGLSSAGYMLLGKIGIPLGFLAGIALFGAILDLKKKFYIKYSGHPLRWLRAKLGWGKSVAELARRLDMFPAELEAFKPAYTEVFIAKRNGQRRRLLVPDEKTKVLQRRILRRLLAKLRVHPAAHGFVKGRSAIKNAAQHVGQAVVITMDLVDFFPSTKSERLEAYFRRIGWDEKAAKLLTRLTTWDNGLPQGAPTSPALSNLVNFYMDAQIARRVARKKGTYTRYADDIAISYPLDYAHSIQSILEMVRRIARSKGYRIHKAKKLRVLRHHQQQMVTGLVVNTKPQLPRKLRRWLRSVEHHLKTGKPVTLNDAQLKGWKSYQLAIAKQTADMKFNEYRLKENRRVTRYRKTIQNKIIKESAKK